MIGRDVFNKMIIFAGTQNTGKSHNMLATAVILSRLNKGKDKSHGHRILVIDTTKDQGVFSCFNFNLDLDEDMSLEKLNPFVRHDIEIMVNNPAKHDKVNYSAFESFDFSGYDYIFVEVDETMNDDWIREARMILFFQSSDKATLYKNKEILECIAKITEVGKLEFIYNQYLDCKASKDYLLSYLIEDIRMKKYELIQKDDIEIPYEPENMIVALNNKVDGKLNLKKYSRDYKEALFEIVNLLIEVSEKTFKRLIS